MYCSRTGSREEWSWQKKGDFEKSSIVYGRRNFELSVFDGRRRRQHLEVHVVQFQERPEQTKTQDNILSTPQSVDGDTSKFEGGIFMSQLTDDLFVEDRDKCKLTRSEKWADHLRY